MDARGRAIARIQKASDSDEEDDPVTLVTDLLADLIHFSQQHGVGFDRRLRMARQHYEEEHDPHGEFWERLGTRDDDASGNGEDLAPLEEFRAMAGRVIRGYEPGQSMYSLMREISELCAAEIAAVEAVGDE